MAAAKKPVWKVQKVEVGKINLKGNTQPRVTMDRSTIDEYQEQMEDGDVFPAPRAFFDGKEYWLADGFHRVRAAAQIGLKEMPVEVTKGDRRDAQLYAAGANHSHGLRRKPEDKRKAVLTLLTDTEWKKQSDVSIAKFCHVSQPFVGKLRKELEAQGKKQPKERTTASGKKMKTGNIGEASKAKAKAPEPEEEEEIEEEEEVVEEAPAPTAKETKDAVKKFLQERYGKAPMEQKLAAFRAFKLLSELMAIPQNLHIPEVGSAINEMRSLLKSFWNMPWADKISAPDRSAVTRTTNSLFEWIEGGAPLKQDEPKPKKDPKPKYEPSADATKALAWWKKQVGLPKKAKPDADYAKAFDMLHDTDKLSWSDIKEILEGYLLCWAPEGYILQSPLALREKTSKGDVRKWESIWDKYKRHPKYKPLSKPPVCPVDGCGLTLKRQEAQKSGRLYLAYICAKHPKESAPVGEKFVPRVPVKDKR